MFLPVLLLLLALIGSSSPFALDPAWRPLPHVERRGVLTGVAASTLVSTLLFPDASSAADATEGRNGARSVESVDSHPVIPVWPSWGGGRVVPVSLGGTHQDPFLLLAHHKHWFDPRDPLRGPFRAVGSALGLPYVDVEGFSTHPHRGFDILTYVTDGSDGFRHRDSLGGSRTYRGGTAQWMRAGSGVLHSEFWETREDRRTDVELFQLWVNLPGSMKFDPPAVRYVGEGTSDPWVELGADDNGGVAVRDVGATLDRSTAAATTTDSEGDGPARSRPRVGILHASIPPGTSWTAPAPRGMSAVLYVREGEAVVLPGGGAGGGQQGSRIAVGKLQTATFAPDGDSVVVRNGARRGGSGGGGGALLDVLLLTGVPLREPVTQAGPIVMNTRGELEDAYRQLSEGTFLDRKEVLQQQRVRYRAGV